MLNLNITDKSMLEGYTAQQLKHMINIINKGYPHFKIPKTGTKPELIERIVSANQFILSFNSKNKNDQQLSSIEQTGGQLDSSKQTKTVKELDKLIKDYNSTQIDSFNVSSDKKLNKISLCGTKAQKIERLEKAGVIITLAR
jgi:hypothetical protein